MYNNEIASLEVSINTSGGAGAATGSVTTIPIQGFLLDVYVNYHASAPATTDLTISDPVFGNILVLSNINTDGAYAPRKQICDDDGVVQALYDLFPLNSALTVALAQADALTACAVVTIRYITP